jgi:hypothetical protein
MAPRVKRGDTTVSTKHREEGSLTYPKHQLKPHGALDWIEMEGWARDCKRLGLTEMDQSALRICIMSAPGRAPVIPRTGGVRKVRFAPKRWGTGKRGAARVCYVYFRDASLILLIKAYSKNEKANLSAAEKAMLKAALNEIKKHVSTKPIT